MSNSVTKEEIIKPDFGDYCTIEQKRYGCDNENYTYKVITRSNSNAWVDVPVDAAKNGSKEIIRDHMEEVVWCICQGVCEDKVLKFRLKDIKNTRKQSHWQPPLTSLQGLIGKYEKKRDEKVLFCKSRVPDPEEKETALAERDCYNEVISDLKKLSSGEGKERTFTETEICQLQSEVHKITGNGEVMQLFNKLLGVNAG